MSAPTSTDIPLDRPTDHPEPAHPSLSSWEALRLVTTREVVERGRTKAFIISAAAVLLLLGGGILLPQLLDGGPVTWRVGLVGEGGESILRVAESIGREDTDPDREFSLEVVRLDDEEAARAALAEGEVELALVDGERLLRQGSSGFAGSDVEEAVQQAAAVTQLEAQLEGTGTTAEQVAEVLGSAPLPVSTVQGEVSAEEEGARSAIAYGGMMLMYFAILMFGNLTLTGIAEEKSSRVVEVLLSTVKPWQLLAGKIIGIGLLGLVQFAVTVLWVLLLIRVTDFLELPAIPIESAVALIVWFTIGYAIYSVTYATAGALVSRMEDAQSAAFPVTTIAVVGFLASFNVLDDPSGTVARITTHVPFMSPFVVPIRVAMNEIALWEQALSIGISLLTIIALVWFAARVYAGGLLHFGGRMKLRQAWRGANR